jgi:vacuolar-type H+-ATPase subunit F/Vma7
MKIVAIGNEVFISGFVLTGVEGIVTENPNEAKKVIKKLIEEKQTAIIFIHDQLAEKIQEEINELKRKISVPVIYEVPSLDSPKKIIDYRKILRQILGV